jgi:hypothetical protein
MKGELKKAYKILAKMQEIKKINPEKTSKEIIKEAINSNEEEINDN